MRFGEINLHKNGRYETYTQVTRMKAERLYNEGNVIYMLPCNTNPYSIWMDLCAVELSVSGDFAKAVNAFEYYNCNNEAGRYACFFIKG